MAEHPRTRMDDQEESEEPKYYVRVTGFSTNTTQDALLNFFENTRRSGGGDIKEIQFNFDEGIADIIFHSQDDAERVVQKTGLQLDGASLITTLKPIPKELPKDHKRLHVMGISDRTIKDGLLAFMEVTSGRKVESILFGDDSNCVVSFMESIDFCELQRICKTSSLDESFLKVEEVIVCDAIEISGFTESTTKDTLLYYFRNNRNGGGDVKNIDMITEGRVVLSFEDPRVVDALLEQVHVIDDANLVINRYYPFLGETSLRNPMREREKTFQVDPHQILFIEEFFHQEFDQLLQESRVKYTRDQGSGEITLDGLESKMNRQKWEKACEVVVGYIDQIVTEKITVSREIWEQMSNDVTEKYDGLGSQMEISHLCEFGKNQDTIIIRGKKTDVRTVSKQLHDSASQVEKQILFEKSKVTKEIDLSEAQMKLLILCGYVEDLKCRYKDLDVVIKDEDHVIQTRGPEDVVNESNLAVWKALAGMKESELKLDKTAIDILASERGKTFLSAILKENSIAAVISCDSKLTEFHLVVTAMDRNTLKKAMDLIQDVTAEESISFDTYQKQLMDSEKWKELKDLIHKTMKENEVEAESAIGGEEQSVKNNIQGSPGLEVYLTNQSQFSIGNSDLSDEEESLKTMVLDVEPKLMHLLQKELDIIEKKYKMKIDWKRKWGKARLSPDGNDVSLFDQGKEEFIILYQKEFQDLQKRDLSLDAVKNMADLEKTTKELTQNFSVVIEKKGDKGLHIFGKEKDVSQVMQTLQAKFGKRRGRKAYREPGNGELPKPDTHARAAMLLLNKTLDNGVVVSVHQGDLTKVQVDVIVNVANENLVHGGGVAGAIVKQGGWQIQQESDALVRRYGRFPVGQVAYTGPGNLPFKRIYHAVGPQWKVHGEARSRQFLINACMNCFYVASKQRMSSIALPGISSGIYGVPKEICAEMMFAAAEMFSAEAPSDNQLKDIRFVNIDTPTYEAFRGEFLNRYGMMKSEDLVFGHNPDDSEFDRSRDAEDTRENQRQKFELVRTGHANAAEDPESKKRADAALQRIAAQGNTTETASSRENRPEHEHLSNNEASKSNSDFIKGFEEKEAKSKGSEHSMKAVADKRAGDQRAFKGKEPSHGMERTDKHGQRGGEEEGKNPKPKAKEEKTKDKGKEKKTETRKEEEEEEEEKENKYEIENERLKEEKEKANEKKNNEDHLDSKNQPCEGKEQNELTKMFSNMAIHQSDDNELINEEKTEIKEENDDLETLDPKKKERATDKTKSINSTTQNEESNAKKDVCGVPDEAAISNAALHQSESKTLKMCGRGRGALGFAPKFPKPGHAVREGSTKKADISHRNDKDVSEYVQEGPPGLSISQEGKEFAKTFTEDVEERRWNQEEDNANARKKQLESECNDTTYGVPSKKVKFDKGEENEEVSTEHEESKAKTDIGEHNNRAYDEGRKDASDKKESEEEKTIDISGSDESEVLKEDENKNVDQNKTVSDQGKDGIESEERDDDGQDSDQDPKDNSTIISAKGTGPKKLMDINDEGEDSKDKNVVITAEGAEPNKPLDFKDGQGYNKDTKKDSSAASSDEIKPSKPMDPKNDDRVEDDQSSDKETKEGKSPHTDSSVKPDNNHQISNQDLNEKRSRDTPVGNCFVLVSMRPNNDQNSYPRDERTSGSSDESSESIVVIDHPEGERFSDPSSSPVNEEEGNDVHLPGQDVNGSKMGNSEEKEEKEKLPVLSVAEKNENDEKEKDAAAGSGGVGEIANPDEERASHSPSEEDISRDKDVAGSLKKADSSSGSSSLSTSTEDQECRLCYHRLDLAQAVKICDHLLCQNCVLKHLEKNELSNTCKICHKSTQIALQPLNGQMKSSVIEGSLPGYEACKTLYIDYEFSEGIQGPFHPNPGTPYDKLSRRTFLPNNEGGKEVLELLTKAFDAGVLFTVGKSTISGKDNQIIFNTDIDHKTNIEGGPTVGYPDPGYLSRAKEQLTAKGIE